MDLVTSRITCLVLLHGQDQREDKLRFIYFFWKQGRWAYILALASDSYLVLLPILFECWIPVVAGKTRSRLHWIVYLSIVFKPSLRRRRTLNVCVAYPNAAGYLPAGRFPSFSLQENHCSLLVAFISLVCLHNKMPVLWKLVRISTPIKIWMTPALHCRAAKRGWEGSLNNKCRLSINW